MGFDNITNCKKCGRLFTQTSSKRICPDCMKEIEEKFTEVREYVRDHPEASIMEVAKQNDVSVELIKQWVREERLMFTCAEASGISCEKCGVPIASGRYCNKCKDDMSHTLGQVYETPKPAEKKADGGARMRYLGKD